MHMKKKRFLLMMLLVVLCAASGTAQKFRLNRQMLRLEGNFVQKEPVSNQTFMYMEDFSITAGETKTVTVYLRSVEPIWMLQCYFNLPDGMTASGAAMTSSFKSLTNNADGFSILDATVDGQYRVVLANMAKTTSIPTVDSQSVFTFKVTAAPTMAAGEYVLSTSDFKFISATSDEGEGYWGTNTSCNVTVNETLATSIALNQQAITLVQGSSQTLIATVTPSYASQNVSWRSSNTSVATVNASGKVTAVSVGNCTITATTTDGTQLSASCQVSVTPVLATGISLNTYNATIYPGGELQLTATVTPSNTTNKAVTWKSSNTNVATVNSSGKVTAIVPGTATITATTTDGSNLSANCNITVMPILATGLTLNLSETNMRQGEHIKLTATVTPSDATDKTVVWSTSNSNIATVATDGTVTAKNIGDATITARTVDGSNLSATCKIHVTQPMATSLSMEQDEMDVFIGETRKMVATILPSDALQELSWSSSRPAVATIDATGNLHAVAEGMTVIVATTVDGSNLTATCIVTVKPCVATGITLNKSELTLAKTESETLIANVQPDNTTNKAVTWKSSNNNIVTVDATGKVTAVAQGAATITATTADGSNLSASCQVTVLDAWVSQIVLDKSEMEVYVEMTDTIHATVMPAEATIQSLVWTSSNESVATVDAEGVVTAVSVGNATITATATDGSGVTATCRVTVPAADGNYLSAESFTIVRGNEVIVPIAMTNSSKITAMQCELRLTGGIEVALDEYGDPDIYLSDRAADHELTCTQRQDFMQILAASITSAPFKSNMGTLYYIHLKADKNLEEGTYMMALRNITLSTIDGQRIKPNDVEVTIGIQPYMLGDANGDTHVDVADFLTTANYILYKDPFPFYFRAADVDANGTVDANDLTGITNIGLGKASGTVNMPVAARAARAPRAAVQSSDRLFIENFDLAAGQTKTVQMMLNNEQTYAGMQCDLTLPTGLTLTKLEKGTRCRNHTLTTNTLDDGSTRVWISSMSSRTISGTSGALLTVTVKATSDFSGTHQLWLRNIVGAHETNDASGERVELIDNMTSINPSAQVVGDVNADGKVDIADVNAVINVMLGKLLASDFPGNADVTGDGKVDIADVNTAINLMLGK